MVKAKIIIIAVCFFAFSSGFSQTVFSGVVLDQDSKEPIIGATITQEGTKKALAVTDMMGRFRIDKPGGGHFIISYVGYRKVTVSAASGTIFYLRPEIATVGEVVVTAQETHGLASASVDSALVTLKNVQTNAEYQITTVEFVSSNGTFTTMKVLPIVTYNVAVNGKIHSVVNGVNYPNDVQASSENIAMGPSTTGSATINANSFDLYKAEFEFYDESPNSRFAETLFVIYNHDFHAYALAKMQESKEVWLKDYNFSFTYHIISGENSYLMSKNDGYLVPNSWIIDAVDLSVPDKYVWQVTTTALDAGWTYCGIVDADKIPLWQVCDPQARLGRTTA